MGKVQQVKYVEPLKSLKRPQTKKERDYSKLWLIFFVFSYIYIISGVVSYYIKCYIKYGNK